MNQAVYDTFIARVKELHTTRALEALLDWDQETYMPPGGAVDRANQMALVAGIAHEKLTADEIGDLLAKLESDDLGDDFVAATNIREVRREYNRAAKLPKSLVEEIAKTTTLAKNAWGKARAESDFGKFAPHLTKLLDLKRQVADLIGWESEPFDALMDEFEPGAKAAEVQVVFEGVKADLVPLVAALKDAPRQPDTSIRERHCPRESQQAFNRRIAEAYGLDFERGRIDVSTHPFCTSMSPRDVRLTTRYDEHYMPMSLFGVMHEVGHALYEQGLDTDHTGTPMGAYCSLGIHESQSRLWENQVGRSNAFWRHFYPQLQEAFPTLADVAREDWCHAINTVRPSLIRVEADEVTYNLHIMLRFELERKMIRDEIAIKDIPEAWNTGMRELLGVTPPDDAQGCLQDIHWSLGIFGYFPTYALGNLYSAQFFEAAGRDMPDLEEQIGRGQLQPLREWLREKVHRQGRRYRANKLVEVVSGEKLSPRPYVNYLNTKFRALYGLD